MPASSSLVEADCTLDDFVRSKPSNKMSYHNLCLHELDPKHNIEYDVFNVVSDYLPELKKMSQSVSLTDKEYYTYRFRPKLLANYLYGNGELYYIILWLNDIWSVKDFNFKKLKLISKTDLSEALSSINSSERDFINSYNELSSESY